MPTNVMRGSLPGVRWSAVFAGVAVALAAHVCLGLFGASIGYAAEARDSRALGAVGALFSFMVAFTATFMGAIVAARISAAADNRTALLHGSLVFCIALIAGAIFLTGTVAATTMGAGFAWNGGMVDSGRDTGTGAPIDSAAGNAAAASLLGGIASLAGLAGAFAGAMVGRTAVAGLSASEATRRSQGRAVRDGQYERAYAAARQEPPPEVERRDESFETLWSDPAFDRRQTTPDDRRRH
jgi:hypothetical protein